MPYMNSNITRPLTVLGIETSCDETAAAVVRMAEGRPTILSDIVLSQAAEHAIYRGVVPEIAARAHVEGIDGAIAAAMAQAGVGFGALDGVAATAGPGLVGGVMVGLSAAKAIALAHDKPFIAVNHLEGHALSPRLAAPTPFPYLLLLVSGGHCQFLAVNGLSSYQRLGSTVDDALGEAFDKCAKVMGLGYPGGPLVEALARTGDAKRVALPRPFIGKPGADFSFAGLKSAVARTWHGWEQPTDQDRADLAACFQAAVADIIEDRTKNAIRAYLEGGAPRQDLRLVVAGGVAANQTLREVLVRVAGEAGFQFSAPPLQHCTDNAAMIALVGAERLAAGFTDPFDTPARPRWPLDPEAARERPTHVAGRKGAKA
jgi:N6-L-threonylcarbamoyladenine synthase